MSPFEIFFGLSSVILGLALTEMAASVAKLLRTNREVRWAIEPIMQAALVILIVIVVWTSMWYMHTRPSFTIGEAAYQTIRLLAVYVCMAAIFGEAESRQVVDLEQHYYDARKVTYGALTVGWLLNAGYQFTFGGNGQWPSILDVLEVAVIAGIYITLAITRRRWVHRILLGFVVVAFASSVLTIPIK